MSDPWAEFRITPEDDPWAEFRVVPKKGPWEKYAKQPAAGPWTKYTAQPTSDYGQPPVGEIIHGATQSYVSDNPDVKVTRPAASGDDRDTRVALTALRMRENNDDFPNEALRYARPYMQGRSMGGVDELVSAVMGGLGAVTGKGFDDPYDVTQEVQRQELARQREETPIFSALSQIGGGVRTGMNMANSGITLAGRAPTQGMLSLPLRSAAAGAEAGLYGLASDFAGTDGSIDERATEALKPENVLTNIGVGAGSVPALDLIQHVIGKPIGNLLKGWWNAEGRGDEALAARLLKDQQSPETLATAVEGAQQLGVDGFRAVDAAGKNTQRLGALAVKTPGEGRASMTEALVGRQLDQGDRIGGYLNEAIAPGGGAYATEQALIARRKASAQPLYTEAFGAAPPQGQFYDDLAQKPIIQQAIKNLEKAAQNSVDGMKEPVNLDDMFNGAMVPGGAPGTVGDETASRALSMRGWDYVKKYLDKYVDSLYTSTSSDEKALAPVYRDLRDTLRERLTTDNPTYGQALQSFADDTTSINAIQTGRDLANARNPDEARALYSAVTEGDKPLAKIGASREFGVKMDAMTPGQDKTRLFNTPNATAKLDTLIEDPVMRAVLGDRLSREGDMVRSSRALTGGSSTFENLAEGGDLEGAGVLRDLIMGNFSSAASQAFSGLVGGAGRLANGLNDKSASRIGEYLMSADPAQIRSLSDLFTKVQQRAQTPSKLPTIFNAGFAGGRAGEPNRGQ